MGEFDFVNEYRALQPLAERDVVAARNKSFDKARAEANGKQLDLARLAYRLPLDQEGSDWFDALVKTDDNTFSLQHDGEEAARLATLVLRARLREGMQITPVILHAAGFAGKRPTVDKGTLSEESQRAIEKLVRRRGQVDKKVEIVAPKAVALTELIKKYDAEDAEATGTKVFSELLKDYSAQIKGVVASTNAALAELTEERRRLANEIDLLWWHLGGRSFLLDTPINAFPIAVKALVVGMDVAAMVQSLPGPYGSYGVIEKALGNEAGEKFKLSDAVRALTSEHAPLATEIGADYGIAPVHAAALEMLTGEQAVSPTAFKRKSGLSFDVRITAFELAVQAYHERLLYRHGWL